MSDEQPEDAPLVRPYALTGGRTRAAGSDFPIEAVIETTLAGRAGKGELAHESKAIVELCISPTTLIEIASKLMVPLGVIRVLIGDLAESGQVRVHHGEQGSSRPDVSLLERVLDGIRAL